MRQKKTDQITSRGITFVVSR